LIELLNVQIGSALIQHHLFTFGAPDFTLHAVLMKPRVQLLETGSQIESVEMILSALCPIRLFQSDTPRPDFRIFETGRGSLVQRGQQVKQVRALFDERIAVIGKRKGN
jgi:hypothetical protein